MKILIKQISLIYFRVYLEVYVIKNPTCFSRWSVSKKVVYNSLPFSGIYRLRCACIDYFPETKQLFEHEYARYSTDISLKDLKNTQIYDIIRPEMLLFELLGA